MIVALIVFAGYGFHYGPGKSCANHFNPGESSKRSGEGVPARKKGESRAVVLFRRSENAPVLHSQGKRLVHHRLLYQVGH